MQEAPKAVVPGKHQSDSAKAFRHDFPRKLSARAHLGSSRAVRPTTAYRGSITDLGIGWKAGEVAMSARCPARPSSNRAINYG